MDHPPRIAPADPPGPLAAQALSRLLPPGMPAPKLFLTVARNEGLLAFLVESGLLGPTGLLDRRALARERPLRRAASRRAPRAATRAAGASLCTESEAHRK